MPFPSTAHQFRRGGPPGPGRPRKNPEKLRGTPWLDYLKPGADLEACAAKWVAMSRQGHWQALQRLIRLHESRDPADVPIRASIARRLRLTEAAPQLVGDDQVAAADAIVAALES